MELNKLKDNMLMNQSGGDSVRTAILINNDNVLEFYSNGEGEVIAAITDTKQYILEEYTGYGHDMEGIQEKLENYTEIFKEVESMEVIETERHRCEVLINGKYTIRLEDDILYLDL